MREDRKTRAEKNLRRLGMFAGLSVLGSLSRKTNKTETEELNKKIENLQKQIDEIKKKINL